MSNRRILQTSKPTYMVISKTPLIIQSSSGMQSKVLPNGIIEHLALFDFFNAELVLHEDTTYQLYYIAPNNTRTKIICLS